MTFAATLDACGNTAGPNDWEFVGADSGRGVEVALVTDYLSNGGLLKRPPHSWSSDGQLLVAGNGPKRFSPPTETSIWAISLEDAHVTTLWTIPSSTAFAGIECYRGTATCDLTFTTGRILRRSVAGDTVTILPTRYEAAFASANGRYIVYSNTYQPNDLQMLDATTRVSRSLAIPNITGSYGVAYAIAVSDDGAEISVAKTNSLLLTRYQTSDGAATTWTVPDSPGATGGSIRALQWADGILYALVAWESGAQLRFVQYPVGGGAPIELGTTPKGVSPFSTQLAWRAELRRMVYAYQSGCAELRGEDCLLMQNELELVRGGSAVRVVRGGFGFSNLNLSPDGLTVAYGIYPLYLKRLPD